MRNHNSAHWTIWLEKWITKWFLFELFQSFKFSSFYSTSTRWFMLDKLIQLSKEKALMSAMHFWTPTSSLKDRSMIPPNSASRWDINQKVFRSISPSVSELVPLRGDDGKCHSVSLQVGSQYGKLINRAKCVSLSCVVTSTCESIVQLRVWRVEICFEIWDCRDRIPSRGSAAPYIISVTPMREDDTSRVDRNSLLNDCEERTISIERNGILGPVEAIFMEAEMGSEREFLHNEATSGGSVEASFHRLRGLEHKINWIGGITILMREKF